MTRFDERDLVRVARIAKRRAAQAARAARVSAYNRDRYLAHLDALISRCTCGEWVFQGRPCPACPAIAAARAAEARGALGVAA